MWLHHALYASVPRMNICMASPGATCTRFIFRYSVTYHISAWLRYIVDRVTKNFQMHYTSLIGASLHGLALAQKHKHTQSFIIVK